MRTVNSTDLLISNVLTDTVYNNNKKKTKKIVLHVRFI